MPKDLIQRIILDSQEYHPDSGVRRHLQYERVPGKAFVCIGVRRCGKSTLLYQIMDRLRRQGVDSENILYINLFDDRLDEVRRSHMGDVLEAYYSLYPDKRGRETVYCFFDEIQMVDGWEPFVDRLLRTEMCEVFLTGSSSRMLSKEIATQMRGRSVTWELFPFSFREYLDLREVRYERLSSSTLSVIRRCFDEFWERGGFPEVRDAPPRIRQMTHQEYFRTVVHRDIVERNNASHPRAVFDASLRLLNQVGSMFSVNALTGYLRSVGHKASKTHVGAYVKWFADTYFLFPITVFHPSLSVQNANTRKIYCVDHAMVRSISNGILVNSGHLLENLVFSYLRVLTDRIHYYRTRKGKEVDFVWQDADGKWHLVQVCESLAAPTTRKRELAGLEEAMSEQKFESAILVTRDEDETVETAHNTITVVPAWRYLLALA